MRHLLRLIGISFLLPAIVVAQEQHGTGSMVDGFIENKGQITDQHYQPNPVVKYLLQTPGLNVQLRANGFSYDIYTVTEGAVLPGIRSRARSEILRPVTEGAGQSGIHPEASSEIFRPESREQIRHFHRVDITLPGAAAAPQIVQEDPRAGYFNYYTAATGLAGVTARHYGKVTYRNIYPHIDLEFVATGRADKQVEYNFIVRPGGDPAQIRLKYEGAATELKEGRIWMLTAQGTVGESIPASYIAGAPETMVDVVYSEISPGVYGFRTGTYDRTRTLVIDPMPARDHLSYLGGSGEEFINGAALDGSANHYICGETTSGSLVATVGAYQGSFGGQSDAVLYKFSSGGVIQWATYFGGSGAEAGSDVAVTSGGDIYLGGITYSSGLATAGTAQTGLAGGGDGFVAKFTSGGSLVWSTYYGGSDTEGVYQLGLDASGNLYGCGWTQSSTGIAASTTLQTTYGGGVDIFVFRLSSTTGTRTWGTYYGGAYYEVPWGMAVDPSGNVYVACQAGSAGLGTPGAYQPNYQAGWHGLLLKLNSNGVRQWATYIGTGTSNDYARGVAVDPSGNAIVCGWTGALSLATTGSWQEESGGGLTDGYVMKFNGNGALQWATMYGSNDLDELYRVTTDAAGNIYTVGTSTSAPSTDRFTTPGTYQQERLGQAGGLMAKYDPSGTLLWNSFLGTAITFIETVNVDAANNVYVSGRVTSSPSGFTSPGAYRTSFSGGSYDGFFGRFNQNGCNGVNINLSLQVTPISCTGSWNGAIQVSASGGTQPYKYMVREGRGASFRSSSSFLSLGPGAYSIIVHDNNGCRGTASTTLTNPSPLTGSIVGTTNTTCANADDGTITVQAAGGTPPYQYRLGWTPLQNSGVFTGLAPRGYSAIVEDNNGCEAWAGDTMVREPPEIVSGTITGPTIVNAFTTTSYVTSMQPGLNYEWAVIGGSIASGQGTNAVSVNWGPGIQGSVRVYVHSSPTCGDYTLVLISITPRNDAVEDMSAAGGLWLYPNPATDKVHLRLDQPLPHTMLKVYDIYGRMILEQPLQTEQTISVVSWAKGVYFFNIGATTLRMQK
jgi:hypothetical protein